MASERDSEVGLPWSQFLLKQTFWREEDCDVQISSLYTKAKKQHITTKYAGLEQYQSMSRIWWNAVLCFSTILYLISRYLISQNFYLATFEVWICINDTLCIYMNPLFKPCEQKFLTIWTNWWERSNHNAVAELIQTANLFLLEHREEKETQIRSRLEVLEEYNRIGISWKCEVLTSC